MNDILKTQRSFARKALAQETHRFENLYHLICREDWITQALQHVLANQGAKTAGVDGITKVNLKTEEAQAVFVDELQTDLKSGQYHPQPVKRIWIPKPGKTEKRGLGIPTLRDRVVQELLRMLMEPIWESDFLDCSHGFRPGRRTMDCIAQFYIRVNRQGKYFWAIEGDIAACFDEIDPRLLRHFLKKRIQDRKLLDLITRMLRCGVWEEGQVSYPQRGTVQGAVVSPLLANVFLHEFDEWYLRTYRNRPEWSHLKSRQYRRQKEIGGTLMLTRYADDWVAVWNGSRERAEEIKAEIKAFLADEVKLRLSEEKTFITHIDDGFDFLGDRIEGGKRWSDGQWCLFSRVSQKAIRRFRDAVKAITRNTFTDEVAAFTALSGLLRGWGNYYAYAAESRLMDSLDVFVYDQMWKYCRRKNGKVGAQRVYRKYTLPRHLRKTGYFQLGLAVGNTAVRVPRLSSIPRKACKCSQTHTPICSLTIYPIMHEKSASGRGNCWGGKLTCG